MKRSAQYAGSFYSNKPDELIRSIKECFQNPFGPQKPLDQVEKKSDPIPFFLVPHAGYMYSGPVAAWSFLELSKYAQPDTVIIIGPNHTGLGSEIAIADNVDSWETPLGELEINHELIEKLTDLSHIITKDDRAHSREHSIEVQLPFLQYIYKDPVKFIPITLLNQGMDAAIMLGEIISEACENESITVIASSDFTHYEHHDIASSQDNKVLEKIANLDIKGMYDLKYKLNVSMCGYGPIATTIEAAKRMNRTKGKILAYATSGDVSGMKSQVVGYGAAMFHT
ncbi:MAG: AmmeMemoRadiSam system protein B [Candidatus Thorarchaeota archaeon]